VWATAGFAVAVAFAVEVGLVVDDAVLVADAVRVAEAVAVADALAVADAELVADDLLVEVAEAGAETAGEVRTELLGPADDEAGVLACGVGMDGKLEPGPLGVQAETATATSSAPANVVRRTFMKPPRSHAR
jgi:hypothetical protein